MNSEAQATQKRKSLLFFAPDYGNEVIHSSYDLYLQALHKSQLFDITIMAPNHLAFAERAKSNGFVMHPVSDFARKLLSRTPQLWPILTATRRYRFDVALSHGAYACRGLGQIARNVVGVCHDDVFAGFQHADRLLTLTSGAAEAAEALREDGLDIEVLPYPYHCSFETSVPLPDDDKPLRIGTSGVFEEGDGLGVFIHAAQLVHQACPDARFVIAGAGPTEHDLKELADNIAPFIDFVGPMTGKELAEEIDLYCLTAAEAPFSRALCEMMDAGIACISTCANGPMDILKGGMVAPMVPINDAFMLAVQLQELVEDRAMIARIKMACFERIREEDFSPVVFSHQLVAALSKF